MLTFMFLKEDLVWKRNFQFVDVKSIVGAGKRGKNCGLVYPTSMGKTYVAFMAMDYFLQIGDVVFLANTNALCEQHCADARRLFDLPEKEINLLTGRICVKKRLDLWKNSRIIFATPQTVMSEVKKGTIDFTGKSYFVFDEMHMAADNYDYVHIAHLCQKHNICTLGLTASSGDLQKIDTLERNYNIKWWIYRSFEDKELQQYLFNKKEQLVKLDLTPDHLAGLKILFAIVQETHNNLAETGLLKKNDSHYEDGIKWPFYRLTELNRLRDSVWGFIKKRREEEKADPSLLRSKSYKRSYQFGVHFGAYYHLAHLANLYLTENYETTLKYIDKIYEQLENLNADDPLSAPYHKNNAAKEIIYNEKFQSFWRLLREYVEKKILHPKLKSLQYLILNNEQFKKILIFSNYKDTVDVIYEHLNALDVNCEKIAGTKFMKVKEQQAVLDRFKNDEFPVLIATSVIEAGIHVPKIDILVNYSMPLTGIAQIQRGGRVGRTTIGIIYYMTTKNTQDEVLYYAARSDNRRMHIELMKRLAIQKRIENGEDLIIIRGKQLEFGFLNTAKPG